MTYTDKFGHTNGLFTTIFKPKFPDLYTSVFGETEPELIDAYVAVNYGSRKLIEPIQTDLVTGYIESVIHIHASNWQKVADALQLSYDLLKPYNITETSETDTITDSDEDVENINSNIPFNETEYNEYEKSKDIKVAERTEHQIRTNTRSGTVGNSNNSKIIQEEINLRQINVQKTVIYTILQSITLSVLN